MKLLTSCHSNYFSPSSANFHKRPRSLAHSKSWSLDNEPLKILVHPSVMAAQSSRLETDIVGCNKDRAGKSWGYNKC